MVCSESLACGSVTVLLRARDHKTDNRTNCSTNIGGPVDVRLSGARPDSSHRRISIPDVSPANRALQLATEFMGDGLR